MPRRVLPSLVLIALTAACETDAPGDGSPSLERVRSVTLEESAGQYLAHPGGVAVDERGHVLASDFTGKRIAEWDADGRFVAAYGGPGSGPGEFNAIGETVLALDSVVGAQDYRNRAFHFYRRGTGEYLGSRRMGGLVSTGKVVGGRAWVTNIDTRRGLGMSVWPLGDEPMDETLARLAPLEANLAPLPAEYIQSEPLRGTYPLAHAAPWADSALVGFAAGRYLTVVDRAGAVVDSVFVPARQRRGVPATLVKELEGSRFDPVSLFRRLSGLYGLSRTADGHFVAVHIDPELHGGNRITGRLFVSLVSPDRRRACVDREIPVSDVSQPLVYVRGDSVYVVEQHLEGETGSRTTVTHYRVSPTGCEWLPTQPTGE